MSVDLSDIKIANGIDYWWLYNRICFDNIELVKEFSDFDPRNLDQFKLMFEKYLLPEFTHRSKDIKNKIVKELAGAAKLSSQEADKIWEAMIPPFEQPENSNIFHMTLELLLREFPEMSESQ